MTSAHEWAEYFQQITKNFPAQYLHVQYYFWNNIFGLDLGGYSFRDSGRLPAQYTLQIHPPTKMLKLGCLFKVEHKGVEKIERGRKEGKCPKIKLQRISTCFQLYFELYFQRILNVNTDRWFAEELLTVLKSWSWPSLSRIGDK